MISTPPLEESPQHRRPLNRAAVITCFAAPFSLLVILPVASFALGESISVNHVIAIAAVAAAFGVPICAAGMAMLLPLAQFLLARRRLHAPVVCFAAVAIGVLLFCIPFALGSRFDAENLLYGSVMGLVAGVIFSWAAGISWRRQPR